MTRRPFPFITIALLFLFGTRPLVARQNAAHPGETEFGTNPTLFATMAAINAAGYDAGLDSPLNARFQVRRQVREEIQKKNIPCLPELKRFYQAHKKSTDTADLSQYISFALIAGGAPDFTLPQSNVPPDVESLRGFSPLLAEFYKEADLENLWKRAQGAYALAISQYQDQIINTLFEANGYVRNPSGSGTLGRSFQIFFGMLAAPDQVQIRSYNNNYYIVITPTNAPVGNDVRDAYLSYLLDPLTFRYSTVIKEKRPLEKYAQDAPALPLEYKDNFSLLVTQCLIKAIDSRLIHGTEDRAAFVNEAMREGFILTSAFADLLPAYEKQDEALRLYYPDLINAVDVHKVEKQLKKIQFVQSIPSRVVAPPAQVQLNPAEDSLERAEGLYEQHDFANAEKLFRKVFEQTTDKSMQGRAYYGLARIAVQENKKDEALDLFQRTADDNPTPAITAWSHVYLGRLALAAGDPGKASTQFKLALAVPEASEKAHEAAEKGLKSASQGENQQ